MSVLFYLLLILFLGLCVFLTLIILVQESKSMGLGAAFGGNSSDSMFGTSTADILKKFTAYLATFFLVGCLILSLWTSALGRHSIKQIKPSIEEVGE
jgi:preprotein translocase subunit SecG